IVGSVLIAVNGSEFFTQDLEDHEDENTIDAEFERISDDDKAPEATRGNGRTTQRREAAAQVVSPEEATLNNLLKAHFEKERGKTGGPYFDGVIAKKSFQERQKIALDLGLLKNTPAANLGEHAADAAAEEAVKAFLPPDQDPISLASQLWSELVSKGEE